MITWIHIQTVKQAVMDGQHYISREEKLIPLWGNTSVPEQLNIKAVTGACKLIAGCSLSCFWPHLQWHHLAYATEIKSIQLHDSPWDSTSCSYSWDTPIMLLSSDDQTSLWRHLFFSNNITGLHITTRCSTRCSPIVYRLFHIGMCKPYADLNEWGNKPGKWEKSMWMGKNQWG